MFCCHRGSTLGRAKWWLADPSDSRTVIPITASSIFSCFTHSFFFYSVCLLPLKPFEFFFSSSLCIPPLAVVHYVKCSHFLHAANPPTEGYTVRSAFVLILFVWNWKLYCDVYIWINWNRNSELDWTMGPDQWLHFCFSLHFTTCTFLPSQYYRLQ